MASRPITLSCDCGATATVEYGGRWTCPTCGKQYDTSRIPSTEVEALFSGVRRYKLLTIGPPLVAAVVFVPLAVLDDLKWSFLLFLICIAWGLIALPIIRRRTREHVHRSTSRWTLEAE